MWSSQRRELGVGIRDHAKAGEELLRMGIDVVTGGNHSWDRKEILDFLPP